MNRALTKFEQSRIGDLSPLRPYIPGDPLRPLPEGGAVNDFAVSFEMLASMSSPPTSARLMLQRPPLTATDNVEAVFLPRSEVCTKVASDDSQEWTSVIPAPPSSTDSLVLGQVRGAAGSCGQPARPELEPQGLATGAEMSPWPSASSLSSSQNTSTAPARGGGLVQSLTGQNDGHGRCTLPSGLAIKDGERCAEEREEGIVGWKAGIVAARPDPAPHSPAAFAAITSTAAAAAGRCRTRRRGTRRGTRRCRCAMAGRWTPWPSRLRCSRQFRPRRRRRDGSCCTRRSRRTSTTAATTPSCGPRRRRGTTRTGGSRRNGRPGRRRRRTRTRWCKGRRAARGGGPAAGAAGAAGATAAGDGGGGDVAVAVGEQPVVGAGGWWGATAGR